jgi:4-amino-4-deoxy-L-arabinose transferase-like glycosyltransferase
LPILVLLAFTLAVRAPTFGNPLLEPDEQFYLLVGDRLLHGYWPYVDLWDRKPVGLFLFYAGVRALGGLGIVEYQIVATLCAGGTAALIFAIARRRATETGAFIAAAGYILLLAPLRGEGGQASVIYNLLTATAAWATFRGIDTGEQRRLLRLFLLAMIAIGVAIQFKYTPFVEGGLFGLHFLLRLRRCGMTTPRLLMTAVAMVSVALAPTLAAILSYALAGHIEAFAQANFISVFERLPFPAESRTVQRKLILIATAPLVVVASTGFFRHWRKDGGDHADAMLLIGWTLAAVVAFAMLGDVFDHYFIPVSLPLSVAAASAIDRGRLGFAFGVALPLWPALLKPPSTYQTAAAIRSAHILAGAVEPFVRTRCLYVYDGPPILYLLTGACAPTRYLYPDHLTNPSEARALGVDAGDEMARLLTTRPGAIVTADVPLGPRVNPHPQTILWSALVRDYVLAARIPVSGRINYVWALRARHGGTALHDAHALPPL